MHLRVRCCAFFHVASSKSKHIECEKCILMAQKKNERLTKTTATCYIVALVALIGRRKQACKQFNADQLTCGVTFSIAYGHLFGMHILTEIIPNSSDFTFILRCVIKLANMLTQMNKKREKNRNTHTHTVAKHKIDCSIFFWMK